MNKSREEAGFDAAKCGLFLILFVSLMLCLASISVPTMILRAGD